MTETVQQITPQNFIRLGIAAFKEHELREIVAVFCKLPGIAPHEIAELRAEVASLREANKTFADHAIHGIAPSVGMPIDPPHAVISAAMQEIPEDGCEYEHIEAAYRAMRVALSSTEGK